VSGVGGERLVRAWRTSVAPFDAQAGRARFLEAFAANRARYGRTVWTKPSRRYILAAVAAAMACAVALAWWSVPPRLTFETAAGEGQAGAWLATGEANELPLTFSEGTRVVLTADSRGRVEELGRVGATFLLERGEVRARVVHRKDTNWRFRAGPFEVQVTGTALAVEWDPDHERFAVRVDEGSVVVRGPSVGTVQEVHSGERCLVDLPSHTMRVTSAGDEETAPPGASGSAAVDSPSAVPSTSASTPSKRPALAPVAAPSWTKLEERGDYDGAYAAVRSAGLASVLRASSADELLRLAQVGQLSGHPNIERQALLTCRRRFPGTEQAAVAAYELGRTSSPSEASRWFSAYLDEQPNGPLAREASGRLVEALASAGDDGGARAAAARYLARYPNGPHAAVARHVLSGATE
jgi:TolA-binding protein